MYMALANSSSFRTYLRMARKIDQSRQDHLVVAYWRLAWMVTMQGVTKTKAIDIGDQCN
jgi:hypothetical protein